MRVFKLLFALGLILACAVLALAVSDELSIGQVRLYEMLGSAHVVLLVLATARLHPADKGASAEWLYTAGFAHTLIAVGCAIVLATDALGASAVTVVDLAPALKVMAGGVLPHAVAVIAGRFLDQHPGGPAHSSAPLPGSGALPGQLDAAAHKRIAELLAEQGKLLQSLVDLLRANIESWTKANDAAQQLDTKVTAAANRIAAVESAARSLAGGLHTAAAEATKLEADLRGALAVVRDLRKLEESIAELLSSRIFQQGP